MFVGVHERQLDPKGRLALPAAFRPRFEPRCFLTIGRDNCIDVLTEEAMDDMAKDLLDKVRRNEISRNEARAISSRSYEATIDAQGRINLDQTLRDTPEWFWARKSSCRVHSTASKSGNPHATNAIWKRAQP